MSTPAPDPRALRTADLVVVGGGPGGLAAATVAASRALDVVLLDEQATPGGRLRLQYHRDPRDGAVWDGGRVARRMADEAARAGAVAIHGAAVWSIEPNRAQEVDGGQVDEAYPWLVSWHRPGEGVAQSRTRAIVLATGARQNPVAFPGWTLPGVLTAGAVQSMVQEHDTLPGRRVLIVGVDVLALQVAECLADRGCEVVGIVSAPALVDDNHASNARSAFAELVRLARWAPSRWARSLGRLAAAPGTSRAAFALFPAGGMVVGGLRFMPKVVLQQANGHACVTSATICQVGRSGKLRAETCRTVEVDVICTSAGLTPLTELASLAGCELVYEEALGGFLPLHDPSGRTTVRGVFVAGSMAGVDGAQIAISQGTAAGVGVCRYLGRTPATGETRLGAEAQDQRPMPSASGLPAFAQDAGAGRARVYEAWVRRMSGG